MSVRRLLLMKRKAISGRERARRMTKSLILPASVALVLRNFLRAGVLKKRSSTRTVVPISQPASSISGVFPPEMSTRVPRSSDARRVRSEKRETDAIVGSASPRKPSVETFCRSEAEAILLVAWRRIAVSASVRDMPRPLSVTRMKLVPPPMISISTASAPASIAFSTSSLTTEAGRSTTSPAAILLMVASSST